MLVDHFDKLDDPPVERTRLHPMPDIMLTMVRGMIAGCEGWNEIEDFGRTRFDFLRHYLPVENGIPSDETLCVASTALSIRNSFNSAS